MESKRLKINIANYVKRLKNIDFFQPLYEAIVNSLDANAENIKIKFEKQIIDIHSKNQEEKIIGFSIEDDGDGFNDSNLDSFFEMMQMDKSKGKLGSGRFIWLKVFDNITIDSHLLDKNISINFVKDYDKISETEIVTNNRQTSTIIKFENVTKEYKTSLPLYNLEEITKKIEYQLLPKLLLLKQNKRNFNIIIDSESNNITPNDIPTLNDIEFDVINKKHKEKFKLYYDIKKDTNKNVNAYYVAHGRQVKEFTKEAQLPPTPNNVSIIMFLSSKYFDDHINDDRNGFDIDMNNPTDQSPICFNEINEKLKEHTDKIIFDLLPEIKIQNEKDLNDAIDEAVYLYEYLLNDKDIIMSKTDRIKTALKEYEKDKKDNIQNFQKILKNKNISDSEYNEIVSDTKRIGEIELGRYIAYRQQIIKHLMMLRDNQEEDEGKLHDVFITYLDKDSKKDKNKKQTYNRHKDINLWLLDDKFMFYKNIFSDESVKNIKKAIKNDDSFYSENDLEPDITIFYNKENVENKIDVVVVEIKAINIKQAEAKNKSISLEQINSNIGIIKNEINNINNCYGFVITKLDAKTVERLEYNNAIKLYSNGDIPYLYSYNPKNNAHIFIVDINSIILDANTRNKVFLDILKGKH